MKSHVAKILKRPTRSRRMMSVALDSEQMELVEKLSLFFSRETSRPFSKNQVVEEAVRAFTDESAEYIAEQYAIDIRSVTLTEMRDYKCGTSVNIAAFDTVVLPVRDEPAAQKKIFHEHTWYPVTLDKTKLDKIRYAAFYIGAPTSGVTHYARVTAFKPLDGGSGSYRLFFDEPEALPEKIESGNPLRRPRYTTLALVLEAKTLDDLF